MLHNIAAGFMGFSGAYSHALRHKIAALVFKVLVAPLDTDAARDLMQQASPWDLICRRCNITNRLSESLFASNVCFQP